MGKKSKRKGKNLPDRSPISPATSKNRRNFFLAFLSFFLLTFVAYLITLKSGQQYLFFKIAMIINAGVAPVYSILASAYTKNPIIKKLTPITCTAIAVMSVYLVVAGQPKDSQRVSPYLDDRVEGVIAELERRVSKLDRQQSSKARETFQTNEESAAIQELDRGRVLFENGNIKEALLAFGSAIDFNPKLVVAFLFRGIAHFRMEAFVNALADFARASSLGQKIKHFNFLVGYSHYHVGNYEAAVSALNATLSKNDDDALAYYFRGSSQFKRGSFQEAASDSTNAIERYPKDRKGYLHPGAVAEAYDLLALTYVKLGQRDRALSCVNTAIKIDPSCSHCYFTKGFIHLREQDDFSIDKAIVEFSRAIELDAKDPWAYANRGMCYMQKKKYEKALEDFEQAIDLKPNFAMAQFGKLAVLTNKGDKIKVQKQMEWIKQAAERGYLDFSESTFTFTGGDKKWIFNGYKFNEGRSR
jgi:tetratricopeptide (TPR) repeat protein